MNMSLFFSNYATEESCKLFFKARKESLGLVCKTCGSLKHYWIGKENRWKCKECGSSTSLKTDTVMEHSNLGYKPWLWGIYLMSLTKKGFSTLEIQRLIGHSRYESIWLMVQKVRISMGNKDASYVLDGYVEMDEGFFEGHRKKADTTGIIDKPAKELDRQVKAIVAVSSKPIAIEEQKENRPNTKCGFVKMNVVQSICTTEVIEEARKMVQKSATVVTDGKRCYNGLKDICKVHIKTIVEDKTLVAKTFPWVHTAISNAKKKILGLHHQVKDAYMQNYLNEFCYKFNRRYFGEKLFDRLLDATLSNAWYKPFPNSV